MSQNHLRERVGQKLIDEHSFYSGRTDFNGFASRSFGYIELAMPPDVRQRFALPLSARTDLDCARRLGVARKFILNLPEGRRPSAHQTAKPSV